ncbi:MAG: hypothetical protein PHD73_04475 [Sediminibacterium sp.]|nr:hypothetical protein [Sediminibacterium sp.]
MEVLNSHERQGKTVGEIEGSYKMMGLSILFVLVMMVYSSLTRSSDKLESQTAQKANVELVQNH